MSQNGSDRPLGSEHEPEGDRPGREPLFNAPWPALSLSLALVGLYGWQSTFADQGRVFERFGLIAGGAGEGARLITSLFVHGGWAHVLLNAGFCLAFGSGVSRRFGSGPAGALAFFAFFLLCGALAGEACIRLKAGSSVVLIGASGGVSGLMAGASRLLGAEREGRLAPFASAPVISMAAAWLVVNLLIAVLGFAPGMGAAPVAWEAHLAGYAAGLLLIGPATALLARTAHGKVDSRA